MLGKQPEGLLKELAMWEISWVLDMVKQPELAVREISSVMDMVKSPETVDWPPEVGKQRGEEEAI